MANGLMLCALTGSGAQSPKTARKQRSYIPPPPAWGSPNELDADVAAAMRPVSAYGALEMQARSRRDRAEIASRSRRDRPPTPNMPPLAIAITNSHFYYNSQRALEFYAHVGHLRNVGLGEQLASGELRRKVAMMSSGAAEDVFKLSAAM